MQLALTKRFSGSLAPEVSFLDSWSWFEDRNSLKKTKWSTYRQTRHVQIHRAPAICSLVWARRVTNIRRSLILYRACPKHDPHPGPLCTIIVVTDCDGDAAVAANRLLANLLSARVRPGLPREKTPKSHDPRWYICHLSSSGVRLLAGHPRPHDHPSATAGSARLRAEDTRFEHLAGPSQASGSSSILAQHPGACTFGVCMQPMNVFGLRIENQIPCLRETTAMFDCEGMVKWN